jgi:hypothetical protein
VRIEDRADAASEWPVIVAIAASVAPTGASRITAMPRKSLNVTPTMPAALHAFIHENDGVAARMWWRLGRRRNNIGLLSSLGICGWLAGPHRQHHSVSSAIMGEQLAFLDSVLGS